MQSSLRDCSEYFKNILVGDKPLSWVKPYRNRLACWYLRTSNTAPISTNRQKSRLWGGYEQILRRLLLAIQLAALNSLFLPDLAYASSQLLQPLLPTPIALAAMNQLAPDEIKEISREAAADEKIIKGTNGIKGTERTRAALTEKLRPPLPAFRNSAEPIKPKQQNISFTDTLTPFATATTPPNAQAISPNKINTQHTKEPLHSPCSKECRRRQYASTASRHDAATGAMQRFPKLRVSADAPITLEFQQAELSAVLQAFARFTGLNIIASQQVRGTVSMRLDQVPWRRAFDLLLDSHGLAMQQRGNIIWVAPIQELVQRERQRLETHAKEVELEPLTSRIFELRYQRAEDVRKLLSGSGAQRILSKRGAAMADGRTNQLFVTDLADSMEQIQALLLAIDQPIKQVSIEARIVEAEQGFSRSLGARLSLLGIAGDTNGAPPPSTLVPHRFLTAPNGALYDLPASPLAGFNPATAGTTLFSAAASHVIALELSMLETDGRGQLLSNPRVVTADRAKALIEQGTELPYQAKVGNGVSGVQFRRAGLKLEVTPHITPNGHVILDIDVSKDSVGEETVSGPAIHTKHVQTQVQVENGGTVAIGGIFTQDQRTDIVRVPGLGKLPLIGALFRRSVKSHRKSELLVFITPDIVTSTLNEAPPKPHARNANADHRINIGQDGVTPFTD